jgi:pilus assembly protein Flp/PilA
MNMLQLLQTWLSSRQAKDETGATAVEYGLLVALIAAIIVGTVGILGGQVNDAFQTIVDALPE